MAMPLAVLCAAAVFLLASMAWAAPTGPTAWCDHHVPCMAQEGHRHPSDGLGASAQHCLSDPGCAGGFTLAFGGLLLAALVAPRLLAAAAAPWWTPLVLHRERIRALWLCRTIEHPPRCAT